MGIAVQKHKPRLKPCLKLHAAGEGHILLTSSFWKESVTALLNLVVTFCWKDRRFNGVLFAFVV